MNAVMINKKAARKNKAMKKAQKAAKRRYGRVRGFAPKAKIRKLLTLKSEEAVSFTNAREHLLKENAGKPDLPVLIEALKAEGLNGLSGSDFPTARKLESFASSQAAKKYLIVNAVECEPGLLHDEWILKHRLGDVEYGIEVLKGCFSFDGVFLAAKTAQDAPSAGYSFVRVPDRYPMGQERLLIKNVLRLELSNDDIPTRKGILVLNVQTVLAIGRTVREGSSDSRYLTAAELPDASALVVEADIGADVKAVAEQLFPSRKDIYVGSGLMGVHPLQEGEKVSASTCFIGCGSTTDYASAAKCKGCGGCTRGCPEGVDVRGIVRALEKGNTNGFEAFHPENCIGCGNCTYICAAGKDLRSIIAEINESKAR